MNRPCFELHGIFINDVKTYTTFFKIDIIEVNKNKSQDDLIKFNTIFNAFNYGDEESAKVSLISQITPLVEAFYRQYENENKE